MKRCFECNKSIDGFTEAVICEWCGVELCIECYDSHLEVHEGEGFDENFMAC